MSWKIVAKTLIVFVGTVIAYVLAVMIWVRVRFGPPSPGGAMATDALGVQKMLHSPSYLLMVVAILLLAGWLLKRWLVA